MKVPELKGGQMITIAYIIAILLVLYIVYKILGATGLIKTKAKKKAIAEKSEAIAEVREMDWFDPMILENKPTGYKSLGIKGKDYAGRLRNAIRGFGTNEEAIYAVFGELKNKWNIAEVALNYKVIYGLDLKVDILNDLNEREVVVLYNLIKKLPEL